MSRIQCTLCYLWFASELGLKIHYSQMHASIGECNRKWKAKSSNNNSNLFVTMTKLHPVHIVL